MTNLEYILYGITQRKKNKKIMIKKKYMGKRIFEWDENLKEQYMNDENIINERKTFSMKKHLIKI
jgi:hypothetical protein